MFSLFLLKVVNYQKIREKLEPNLVIFWIFSAIFWAKSKIFTLIWKEVQYSLYLEAVDLTLRETSHPGSVPSSERPIKITATKELVLLENQLVKKKAMALQA